MSIKNLWKKNGLHAIKFYFEKIDGKIKFITYKEYWEKFGVSHIGVQNHVGFKHNIDEHTSAIILFSSQSDTYLPELGKIQNIKLNNNLFSYANKMIFFKNADFSLFFTLHENKINFPKWTWGLTKEHLVRNATKGFVESYSMCKNEHALYAQLLHNQLNFKWYIDNTIISSLNLGLLMPRDAILLLKFNSTDIHIKNYVEKMEKGFKENDIQDLCNTLDWSMPI